MGPGFAMNLEPGINFVPKIDRRRHIPEPLPVKLVTVDDARLPATQGLEPQLDHLYVALLGFERDRSEPGITYRAENFRLRFDLVETVTARADLRPLQIQVPSLQVQEQKFLAEEIEYARQKGLAPGQDCLMLKDPAGNWLAIVEAVIIG